MQLRLPRSLHYPITINKLVKPSGATLNKGDVLFLYTYTTEVREGSRDGEETIVKKPFTARFLSEYEGEMGPWKIRERDVLNQSVEVVEVVEDCPHSEQYAGMCTACGKDMTM